MPDNFSDKSNPQTAVGAGVPGTSGNHRSLQSLFPFWPLPGIGQRIIRSTAAVLLCFLVYVLRGYQGIPFYSALAVLQCIQPYRENMLQMARKRVTGTFVGAVWGLLLLLLETRTPAAAYLGENELLCFLLAGFLTGVVIYSTVMLKIQQTAYFSCVVFLSITINHVTDANPYLFVWNRVLDTLIGVGLAILVNQFQLPREKRRDILFVSGVDDTMVEGGGSLSSYSRVELNRLIEQGAQFTVSTNRTPATIRETLPGVRLRLPVIAMDGAVLYNMEENIYECCCTIRPETAAALQEFLRTRDVHGFTNTVTENLLIISYDLLANPAQQDIYDRHRRSPYRNYLCQSGRPTENVVYFLLMEPKERMAALYRELASMPWFQDLRVVYKDSTTYQGYAFMKLYSPEATRPRMLARLQDMLETRRAITFGSVEGSCDVVIRNADKNALVREVKKLYEPVKLF